MKKTFIDLQNRDIIKFTKKNKIQGDADERIYSCQSVLWCWWIGHGL